jgi:ATP-binding cassette subfamily B protein RaxB
MNELLSRLRLRGGSRIPEILQTEAAECGLACLAMCASAHGYDTDLGTLRRRFPTSLKGVTLKTLIDIAAQLDLAARPLRLELAELSQLATPCILHWDMRHFVVLARIEGKHAVIHDPAVGARRISLEEVGRHFTGVALELTPTPAFRPRRERPRVTLGELLGKVRGLRGSLIQIGVLSLALELLALMLPWISQWIVDDVVVTNDLSLLNVLAIALVLLGISQVSIGAFRAWVVVFIGTQVNLQWMSNVFGHMMKLPIGYFEKRHLGDVTSRFRATTEIQQALTQGFVEAILDGFMAIIAIFVMYFYNVVLASLVLLAVVLYAVFRMSLYRTYRARSEEVVVRGALVDSHIIESLRGIQSIKLFNFENARRASWFNLQVDQFNARIQQRKLDIVYQVGFGLLSVIENALVLWLAAHLILERQFTVGMLLAFIAYKSQFRSRIGALIDRIFQFRLLQIQQERLADIVLTETESGDAGRQSLPAKAGGRVIEARDLWYRYGDDEPWILQGIDLTLSPGDSLVITGPSGCGKTTLVKLLLGLYTPSRGEIRVDGINLAHLRLEDYRAEVATVMQEDRLLAGSILENVCFFDAKPDIERLRACLAQAAVLDEIDEMPMGLQTLVGDMGTTLSSGQAQRVLLARALYKQPKIIVMDEATSHLDDNNQARVRQRLADTGMTRIAVTHRLGMITANDTVLRMENGRLIAA